LPPCSRYQKFDAEQYYEILHEADRMDSLIGAHWNVMAESDPRHHTKLVVDEWGGWYAPGTEPFAEALIGQQSTMRDAVLAGLTLDTFNRHADKVAMANVAQLVNCLQSLFLAHEDKFCVTPTYHVFDLYTAHQGARSVRAVVAAPENHYRRNGFDAGVKRLGLGERKPAHDYGDRPIVRAGARSGNSVARRHRAFRGGGDSGRGRSARAQQFCRAARRGAASCQRHPKRQRAGARVPAGFGNAHYG